MTTSVRPRLAVRLTSGALLFLILGLMAEGASRLAITYKDQIRGAMRRAPGIGAGLRDYQMPDPRHSHNWLLRPGYSTTFAGALREAERSGRVLGARVLRETAHSQHVSPDSVIFRVNSAGFKGPELDQSGLRVRILTVGDSCTFGNLVDYTSYPRTIERVLAQNGYCPEVVNAGVEGYSPSNVLLRLPELLALQPEIVTVQIGWNALYQESRPFGKCGRSLCVSVVARRLFDRLRGVTERDEALDLAGKTKRPDPNDPVLARLDSYVPLFMPDVDSIVAAFSNAGSKVVITTVPGLYRASEAPTPRALAIGHLPYFTDNPYVLAKLTERYNDELRKLARRRGLPLIDLDSWSATALRPRDRFFSDAAHLTAEGQILIGKYMAEQLETVLSSTAKSCRRAPA